MVVACLGPASAGLAKPTTKPNAATTRLRRARTRLFWFGLNAERRSAAATFMCRLPPAVCGGATIGLRASYLNAWEVERNSGGNRLRLRSLMSDVSGNASDSLVLNWLHLR